MLGVFAWSSERPGLAFVLSLKLSQSLKAD
jgi:hypothetical protein